MPKSKVPRALTIAGSDSGGGAGIQADLKTFAALGVHGMTAITSVTAQNTVAVTAIQDVEPEIVGAQIEAVVSDIGVDAAKTGMLHTSRIIDVVADSVKKYGFPLVVDPVMVAKSGARLLEPEAEASLIKRLLPLATVVTPNAPEAGAICDVPVVDVESAELAAKRIADLGPKAVVVKGGHLATDVVVDVLYAGGRIVRLEGERHRVETTHGTGCSFSAAITAELAKGRDIEGAVRVAKDLVNSGVRFGLAIGEGHGPVNPMARLHNQAEMTSVLADVAAGVAILESSTEASALIPESQSNLVMALPWARAVEDVAAVPGRIVRVGDRVKASSLPAFGGSEHVARTVLTAMRYNPEIRSAMNVRHSKTIVDACRELDLAVSYYDRREEPPEVSKVEGRTTSWGAEQAIKRLGKVPDIIYHEGGWGKEPMIIVLGTRASDVAQLAVEIGKKVGG